MNDINNILINVKFNDVSDKPLWAIMLVIVALLGYAFYTDLFKDRIITNSTTLSLATISFATSIFVYQDLAFHFIVAGVFIFALLLVTLFADFGGGDFKIFSALALLLGAAVIPLFLLMCIITLIMSLPQIIRNFKKRKEAGKFKMGHAPLAPGTAIAFPILLAIMGLSPLKALIILAGIFLSVGWYYMDDKMTQRALLKQKNKDSQEDLPAD